MSIYTKTGDKGETSLASGQRVKKTDARIEAYGTVDELNSQIGLLRAQIGLRPDRVQITDQITGVDSQLMWIQNKLFNLGAGLSEAPGEWLNEADVKQLEGWIDAMQAEVPPMRSFVLPAGSVGVCQCHVCRTICRRTERRMIELKEGGKTTAEGMDVYLQFMNRLSDFLFVLSRFVGFKNGENEEKWLKN